MVGSFSPSLSDMDRVAKQKGNRQSRILEQHSQPARSNRRPRSTRPSSSRMNVRSSLAHTEHAPGATTSPACNKCEEAMSQSSWGSAKAGHLVKLRAVILPPQDTGQNTLKKKRQWLSHVQLFATPWTVARRAPPSTGFSRRKYWSGCHSLLQGIFPTQEANLSLLNCRQILYHLSHQGSPQNY